MKPRPRKITLIGRFVVEAAVVGWFTAILVTFAVLLLTNIDGPLWLKVIVAVVFLAYPTLIAVGGIVEWVGSLLEREP